MKYMRISCANLDLLSHGAQTKRRKVEGGCSICYNELAPGLQRARTLERLVWWELPSLVLEGVKEAVSIDPSPVPSLPTRSAGAENSRTNLSQNDRMCIWFIR
jgi:hypothetical protein